MGPWFGGGTIFPLFAVSEIMVYKWQLTLNYTNTKRWHFNLYSCWDFLSVSLMPCVCGLVYQLSSVHNKVHTYITAMYITLIKTGGSQTPSNMECALANVVHKISKPETFSQPDRFYQLAFHIPDVTQYRHCSLNDKQRFLQEALRKQRFRMLH